MELDNIIWIIVWAFIIVYSLVSSKKNKAQAHQRQKREVTTVPAVEQHESKPMPPLVGPQRQRASLQKSSSNPLMDVIVEVKKSKEPQAEPILPVEGERVTHKPIQAPMATIKSPENRDAIWLKDKENLKKAIIFGQILSPKF